MRQSLATRAIPSPKLLVKDNKKINEKWEFPTRLVIPATNFTTTFSKIGYPRIKRLLDKGKTNHSHVSIVQESILRDILEEPKIKIDQVKIDSFEAIIVYLSIKITTMKK